MVDSMIREDSEYYDPITKAARCFTNLVFLLQQGPQPLGVKEIYNTVHFILVAHYKSPDQVLSSFGSETVIKLSELSAGEISLSANMYKFAVEIGFSESISQHSLFDDFNVILSRVGLRADRHVFDSIHEKVVQSQKSYFNKK